MTYTVRFAHLAEAPHLKPGDVLRHGDKVGLMGSTGQSTGAHLHIDCAEGPHKERYSLGDMESNRVMPCPRQLNYFIDAELFGGPIKITTPYCDAEYQRERDKVHHGYDVIPSRGGIGSPIFWNRTAEGVVLAVLDDPSYGHMVQVGFSV